MLLKRMLDIMVSALGIFLAAPIMILTGLAIWISSGRPIFFRQVRPGINGKPFTIMKFRTLREPSKSEEACLPSRADTLARETPLGNFLRRTALDELPQLWNVLVGDMSLVGPRPLLMCYLDIYTPEQMRRQEVKPGVTGWAQVNGRTRITWEDKFKLDLWYVDNQSFGLDMKILMKTFLKLISDLFSGAPAEERFLGPSTK